MNYKKALQTGVVMVCTFLIGTGFSVQAAAPGDHLIPVGIAVGIQLETEGVLIAGFADSSPARNAGLCEGDTIISINDMPIDDAAALSEALLSTDGAVSICIKRDGQSFSLSVTPERSGDIPKLGIYVRDAMAGIGTITYYDPSDGAYGALGHGISQSDTGTLLQTNGGKLVGCTLTTITPGIKGLPGELSGTLNCEQVYGSIEANTACGIFGHSDAVFSGDMLEVAESGEIQPGPATILSGVSGEVCTYAAKICAVYRGSDAGRDMLIEVTDPELLALTGGIVRGMSGSPIVQNGKLIGAVTHVLVNEPGKGYAISMERMLAAAEHANDVETAA